MNDDLDQNINDSIPFPGSDDDADQHQNIMQNNFLPQANYR